MSTNNATLQGTVRELKFKTAQFVHEHGGRVFAEPVTVDISLVVLVM